VCLLESSFRHVCGLALMLLLHKVLPFFHSAFNQLFFLASLVRCFSPFLAFRFTELQFIKMILLLLLMMMKRPTKFVHKLKSERAFYISIPNDEILQTSTAEITSLTKYFSPFC